MPNEVNEAVKPSVERNEDNARTLVTTSDMKNFNVTKFVNNESVKELPNVEIFQSRDHEKTAVSKDFYSHKVEKGDTLWDICKDHLTNSNWGDKPTNAEIIAKVKEIAKLNHISNPDRIEVGTVIKFEKPKPVQNNSSNSGDNSGSWDTTTEQVKANFKKYDADQDGRLTRKEIDDYVQANKGSMARDEREALEAVGRNVKQLEQLSDDDALWEQGVSAKDLQAADEQLKAANYAKGNFEALDKDKNGKITSLELTQYEKANGSSKELDLLKKYYGDIRDNADDRDGGRLGISMHDLAATIQSVVPSR